MAFFSRVPHTLHSVGVLDCTGGSVGATLISYIEEKEKFTPRYHVSVRYDCDTDMAKGIMSAIHTLRLSAPDLSQLRVFFPASHGVSHPYLLKKNFETPTLISREHLALLSEEAFSLFKTEEPSLGTAPLLYAIGGVRVNGYDVLNPIGLRGSTIELNYVVWTCTLSELLHPLIVDTWGSRITVEYFPENLSLSLALVHALPLGPRNFLVAAIGDEASTISTWWHGTLIASATVPLGRRAVVDRVARALNSTPIDAVSFLRNPKDAPKELSSVLDAVLVPLVRECAQKIGAVPQGLLEQHFVPGTIYLVSDEPALASLGSAALNDPSLSGFTFSTALSSLSAVTPLGKECKTVRAGGAYDDTRLRLFGHFCASIDEVRCGGRFLLSQTQL